MDPKRAAAVVSTRPLLDIQNVLPTPFQCRLLGPDTPILNCLIDGGAYDDTCLIVQEEPICERERIHM